MIAIYKDPIQPMETRIAALQALAQTQHPDAIKILHDFMYQSVGVNYALLTATANSLIANQRPEDIIAMINGVASAQKKYINFRTTILRNLENADVTLQIEQLLNLYQVEKENYVQMQESLTRVMGSVDDEKVIPILINVAKDKSVKLSVRSLALEILGKKKHPLITEAFIEMLGDPETQLQIRDFALTAIADIKEARVILALLETYNAGKEDYFILTETLTKALGNFSDPAVIPTLTEIAKNPEFPLTIRKNSLNALIKFNNPKIFDSLLPMMENPDNY
ncbi:MAG: HEAT repeat domain-containing protein, partial [Candidatus Marinimicrobia bacterium]|nr:HEAT repeat domain-containing protein [Candidatus Neomarinimicrobiota bacterium]